MASELCFQSYFPLLHSPQCCQGDSLMWFVLSHHTPASVFLLLPTTLQSATKVLSTSTKTFTPPFATCFLTLYIQLRQS